VLDLNAHGIKNAAALLAGWNGWKDAGLPIATAKKTEVKK
jgi:3-mercaptopyruvate sulfurtransferase SseA